MLENIIGKRYAQALADTITDETKLEPALESLNTFCEAFRAEPHLRGFFAHPSIPTERKAALLTELCGRIQVGDGIRRLVQLLNERKKIIYLENITEYFRHVVDQRLNQVRVDVVSAQSLDGNQKEKISASLSKILGKTILIDTRVDETLLGGIVLQLGGLVVDGSIKNRLALLKRSIEKEEVA